MQVMEPIELNDLRNSKCGLCRIKWNQVESTLLPCAPPLPR